MRTPSFTAFAGILAVTLASVALSATPADAATFKVCVRVNVQITDSDVTVNGIKEDHYLGTGVAGGLEVIGRGFRVKVTQGGADVGTFNAATTDGCFSFVRASNSNFGIRVYGFATDGEDNSVRIHNAGTSTTSWYPGQTYSALWDDQTLEAVNYYVLDGTQSDRWTTIGVAAFGLYRWNNGVNDATVSIGFSENNCGDSGTTHGNAENYIESNNAHLMRVGRCASSSSESRQKMLVTHELGHAMARLYYGHDGADSPLNDDYLPPAATLEPCATRDDVDNDGVEEVVANGYSLSTLEWNSLGFKEGFADFYSARVWNNADAHGSYTRFGTLVDLEAWDSSGGTNTAGGFTWNVCGNNVNGVSTRQDYLRFFWDLHTAACASQPSQHDMLDLYRAVRENNRTGAFDLTDSNYDAAIQYAVDNTLSLTACQAGVVPTYLSHNHGG